MGNFARLFRCSTALLVLGCFVAPHAAADYDRIEENDPSVTYTGTWQEHLGDILSGGRLVAGGLGSRATITFKGTGLDWYEYFSSSVRGGANIYVDGALVDAVPARESGVIDVYGEKQLRYRISGLSDTTHVLTIEGTGARFNFSPTITIDGFVIHRSSTGPDTTPPELVIRAPRNGETVPRWVQLLADSFDNEGSRARVRWYVDGTEIHVDVTQPVTRLNYMYWWVTAGLNSSNREVIPVSDGPHVLTAVARDSSGNETRASVNITIDNSAPSVALVLPSSPFTGVVTVRAVVTGNINPTAGVRFYARASDGTVTLIGQDTTAPYTVTRDTTPIPSGRSFSLWAEVTDLSGNIVRTNGSWSVHIQH
jgi:hypothetical protein